MTDTIVNKLDAIIFDFDGVICESVDVKTEAFGMLFREYPEHLKEIIDFHVLNGGISRYKKFEAIYQDVLKEELTEQKSKDLGRQFSEYVYANVVKSPLVPGAYEFLEKYYKEIQIFIVSGTPQEEMRSIVNEKKLDRYFTEVYGSPDTKADITCRILDQYNIDQNSIIFVGDAINDYHGAQGAGIGFVGRVESGKESPFSDIELMTTVNDIDGLSKFLKDKDLI